MGPSEPTSGHLGTLKGSRGALHSWSFFGGSCASHLGAISRLSWSHLGANLEPSWNCQRILRGAAQLVPFRGQLCNPLWNHLEAILVHLGANMEPSCNHLGAILQHCMVIHKYFQDLPIRLLIFLCVIKKIFYNHK